MPRTLILAAALAASALVAAGPAPAQADVAAFARACSDPEAAAAVIIKNCSRALQTQKLGKKGSAQAFLNRGAAFASLGQPKQALADFDAAIQSFDGIPELWSNRGRALLRLERPDDALTSFRKALELRPGDAVSRLGEATALIELGASDKALPILDALLKSDRRDVRARYQRARALAAMKRNDDALTEVSAVLKAAPNAVPARLLEAQIFEATAPEKALASYAAAIKTAPDDPRAYYRRGRLLDRTGAGDRALPDLRRAWELGYRDEWLHERLLKAE